MSSAQDRYPEFMEDQREFFDRLITDDWETYRSAEWDDVRRREVAAIVARAPARRILDVGCGCGFHDVELANRHGVAEVVGIDYSPRSIETAEREYPHPRVRRQVADIFTFESTHPFDLVVSFQVIEHVVEARSFLDACCRNVRVGGVVAVVTPNRLRPDNRWQRLRRRPLQLIDPQHFREYTPCELRALTDDLPLVPLRTIGLATQFVPPRLARNVVPAAAGRLIARLAPSLSSSYALLWRRL